MRTTLFFSHTFNIHACNTILYLLFLLLIININRGIKIYKKKIHWNIYTLNIAELITFNEKDGIH